VRITVAFVALVFPALASAEVLDKEFSLQALLIANAVGAVLCYWTTRLRPGFLAVLLPLAALLFWVHVSELLDPHVGPAMATEGGMQYVAASWAAPAVFAVACILGFLKRARRSDGES